jgi:hypothetical protein
MTRLLLVLAAGALFWLLARDSGAQPPPQALKAPPVLAGWPREVKGYGKTEDEARRSALHEAVEDVTRCLKIQDPPLTAWQPDEEYVRTHLLAHGEPGADFKLGGVVRKVWVQTLVQSPDFGKMVLLNQAAERRELSVERQTLAGYGLAALSALLATAWGYLRLDEWTGGRFTRWLSLGAATLLVIAGLGWWLST